MRSISLLATLLWSGLATQSLFAQDIPIDYATGQALISIPVYTVNDRSLSHEVRLVYDASGMKVNSKSGLVGVNWSVAAGGEVRRDMRGLPDDFTTTVVGNNRRGWLFTSNSNSSVNAALIGNYSFPADGTTLSCSSENAHYSFINGFNGNVDSEPDMFIFHAGSLSGSFVFDNTGSITSVKTVPYQELKIVAVRTNSTAPISAFEITTSQGVKYTFAAVETSGRSFGSSGHLFLRETSLYNWGVNFNSAWKLTRIDAPDGATIQFSYVSEEYITSVPTEIAYPSATGTPAYQIVNEGNISSSGVRQHLETITTPHLSVFLEPQIIGIYSEGTTLKRITINEITSTSSFFIKSVNFTYAYVLCNADQSQTGSLWFLKEIRVVDACESTNPYQFFYDGIDAAYATIPMPTAGSKHQDIWGYYKNNSGSDRIPKLYVYPSQSGISKVSLYQRSGASDEIVIPGADRLPTTIPTTGTLNKVVFPSGAVTTLTYESHDFYNPITNGTSIGVGLRLKEKKVHDGVSFANDIVTTYEYKKTDGTTSGKIMALPLFWKVNGTHLYGTTYTGWSTLSGLSVAEQWRRLLYRTEENLNPNVDNTDLIAYERVTEKVSTGRGKTVFQFDVPNPLGAASTSDWNPTYTHIARSTGCPNTGLNMPGFYVVPRILQTPYDYARGMMTRVSHFAEGDNNPIKEMIYNYADKSISAGTVKGLWYDFVEHGTSGNYYFMYGAYKINTGKMKVLSSTVERVRDQLSASYVETTTNYTYGSSSHAFITSTTVTNSNGDQSIVRNKYVKDYTYNGTTTSDLQVNMIEKLYNAGQTGVMVEQIQAVTPSGGTEKTISGKLFLFDNFGTNPDVIKPKQELVLDAGSGISSFAMSSYSGSGNSRTFVKNAAYRVAATYKYRAKGDLIRAEDNRRQFNGFHVDNLTGIQIAAVNDAEPQAVVYSSFDHDTDYDFDMVSFTSADKAVSGRTGSYGVGGWVASSPRRLSKTFTKKPSTKYIFSAWYKAPVTTGTHSFSVTIKNTSGTPLLTQTVTYTPAAPNAWQYQELVVDLSGISNTDVVIEIAFTGSLTAPNGGILDDVTFAPQGSELVRSTFNPAFGITSSTSPENRITIYEYTPGGKMRYVRDHEGNIILRTGYTRFNATQPASPISITVASPVYDNVETIFTAHTGCLDVSSILWKVAPASDTTQGAFFSGADEQPYTFTSAGSYVVKLKVRLPSGEKHEVFVPVTVGLKPLDVVICATGATHIETCTPTGYAVESCSGPPPSPVDLYNTSFSVSSVTGCPGGSTYTYTWYKSPIGANSWTSVGTGTSVTIANDLANLSSYDVKCVVSSSCGRTGTSNTKAVTIYQSTPSCSGEDQ